ncbi:hypothetical protein RchiOBHm_Chr6g0244321 [Rosa chinensis]|uniref:Uncharacterized protein n=1 Tax=Rosa chinensis TaxID=74649 RepID=A0A2P6PIZ1_ROSCH|nr:hypothetical protein RchiOBHm_Chr6g0244321 [Rosa chinensis]
MKIHQWITDGLFYTTLGYSQNMIVIAMLKFVAALRVSSICTNMSTRVQTK